MTFEIETLMVGFQEKKKWLILCSILSLSVKQATQYRKNVVDGISWLVVSAILGFGRDPFIPSFGPLVQHACSNNNDVSLQQENMNVSLFAYHGVQRCEVLQKKGFFNSHARMHLEKHLVILQMMFAPKKYSSIGGFMLK